MIKSDVDSRHSLYAASAWYADRLLHEATSDQKSTRLIKSPLKLIDSHCSPM